MEDEGWNILQSAMFEGCEELVERILSVAPEMIDKEADDGWPVFELFEERHEKIVLRLLELYPNLIDAASDNEDITLLHRAADKGLDRVVARLLAVKPQSINAVTGIGRTALHCAASAGHLKVVTRLLAASPELINAIDKKGLTALHHPCSKGYLPVVSHLLAVDPELIHAANTNGWTALHYAAEGGDVPVAEHLLAASPKLVSAVDNTGWTALHVAAFWEHRALVEYLLSVSPALTEAVTNDGWTVLHVTASGADLSTLPVVQALLAIKPELISMQDHHGNTMLHLVVANRKSKELIEEVWRLCPEALRVANCNHDTPFHLALLWGNGAVIEVLQWTLTWEEIESAHASLKNISYEERFRPVLETQCESLSLWLLPEMVSTVFEYLGFERASKGHPHKRPSPRFSC